jgi:hypothetical protein
MWRTILWLVATIGILLTTGGTVQGRTVNRKIVISNQSKSKVSISWVHPQTAERVLMSTPDVMPGADFPLDSFVGHSFVAVELPSPDGVCHRAPKAKCRESTFTVSENDDQHVRITEDIEAIFVDNKVKARQQATNLVGECEATARQTLAASSDPAIVDQAMKDLVLCVQHGVAARLEEVNEEIAFQTSVRTSIASQLENYTCIDEKLDSTEDISTHMWMQGGVRRTVHVKHDRPASRIHVIDNFISVEECIAMENAARPKLHKATVADGRGGSRLSENRKAMQAVRHWKEGCFSLRYCCSLTHLLFLVVNL